MSAAVCTMARREAQVRQILAARLLTMTACKKTRAYKIFREHKVYTTAARTTTVSTPVALCNILIDMWSALIAMSGVN